MWADYTLGGRLTLGSEYYDEAPRSGAPPLITYRQAKIDEWLVKAAQRETNYYGVTDSHLYALIRRHAGVLRGARVAVLGSLEPWYECVALDAGAAQVVTVEYGPRASEDARLSFVTPAEMRARVAAGTWEPFDAAISISSFEHDGLGRYGDPLDGGADISTMAFVRDFVVKPGGHLLFAVPVGGDCVAFNAHRVYGKIRFPLLVAGWTRVDAEGFREEHLFGLWPCASWEQPVLLLQAPLARGRA